MATRKRSVKARSPDSRKRKTEAPIISRKVADALARLRGQLEDCKRELKEAHEQQAATSEVLRVMAGASTDLKTVLETVIANAVKLAGATQGHIRQRDADILRLVAHYGVASDEVAFFAATPLNLTDDDSPSVRAMRENKIVHVLDAQAGRRPDARALRVGARTMLVVPLIREGAAFGFMNIWRSFVEPFTERQIDLVKTFADQAVIAIENVRLFKETKEALEQQTATAEVLRVISSSPGDLEPVFQKMLDNAVRICEAKFGTMFRYDGRLFYLAASVGSPPALVEYQKQRGPFMPERTSRLHDLLRTRQVGHTLDAAAEAFPGVAAKLGAARSQVHVPMLKNNELVGAMVIYRQEARPFTDRQIDLVKNFAAQAVIAIENVRLFNETKEALEQQIATAEILQVISSSPTDTQPVFDAIVKSAVRLFGGLDVTLRLVAGEETEIVASTRPLSAGILRTPLRNDSYPSSRAMLRRELVHLPDVFETDWVNEDFRERARSRGFRAVAIAPMVKERTVIGVINVNRAAAGPWSEKQIALLKTFADQAVIAIENVRLFKELQERLEQQTATSDILRVISQSQRDVQPVFEAIAANARELCGAINGAVFTFDGDLIKYAASDSVSPQGVDAIRQAFPMPPGRTGTTARAVLTRSIAYVPDVREDSEYGLQPLVQAQGFRSALSVPMLLNGSPIGTITVTGAEPAMFSERQIAMLQTFADQAVIAIENTRLFKELQARNAEITESLEQQTAMAEILRVISSSPTDIQPVLNAVAESAARLCDAKDVIVRRVDGDVYHLVAHVGSMPVTPSIELAISRGTFMGRAIRERRTIHIHDVLESHVREEYPESLSFLRQDAVYRTVLCAPLLREDTAIGVIIIRRPDVRPFSDKQIKLLETFADQAVIAIENVRLFKELQARNAEVTESLEQQTVTADILKVISGSPTDTQPVFEAIVKSGVHLFGGMNMALRLVKGDHTESVANTHPLSDPGGFPLALTDESSPSSRALRRREVVQVSDIAAETWITEQTRQRAERRGFRSVLVAPMLKEGIAIGTILVTRAAPGPFTDKQVALLRTFADQAVIAIENVRLFNEIQDKSRQLEVANKHKSDFLAHMSHELRTPLNAIIGFSEVLIERMFGETNPKQDEYLRDIHASGQHLLSLINDILDLSKVEAGRMELELSEFSLPAALQNALTLVRERAQNHGIALELRVDEKLGQIRADERKVKQIVLNLLSNAVKFTPDGGRVEVDAHLNDAAVEVSVKDTGSGIAPEDQASLFEEFRQVGRSAGKQEGTGLGLALTRRFVELHGGTIRVESAPGRGSTFTFTLPLSRPGH